MLLCAHSHTESSPWQVVECASTKWRTLLSHWPCTFQVVGSNSVWHMPWLQEVLWPEAVQKFYLFQIFCLLCVLSLESEINFSLFRSFSPVPLNFHLKAHLPSGIARWITDFCPRGHAFKLSVGQLFEVVCDVVSFWFLYYLGKHSTDISSSFFFFFLKKFIFCDNFEFIHTCTSNFCVHSLYAVFALLALRCFLWLFGVWPRITACSYI